jgi:Zn-dependent M28 family amino/carboxypeptidase
MDLQNVLKRVVTALAGEIGVRSYRDAMRLQQAADFISREFALCGYAVSRQPLNFQGNIYENVIAELKGTGDPEEIIVVGAHYDTVRSTPGADDNASGVAGLLGLAGRLAGARPESTIRFAAFCLEEPPAYRTSSMGSWHYARSLKEARSRVRGMICLEMIGYFDDRPGSQSYPLPLLKLRYPSMGNFIAMVGNMKSGPFTRAVAGNFRKAVDLPVVTLNAPAFVGGIDFSDHWSFNEFGYNAFMVTDTAFYRNPHYHEATDRPDTLDYARMAQVVEGLAGALGAAGGENQIG